MNQEIVYILAGGKSQRFGTDKARAQVEGQPWLIRQAEAWKRMGFSVYAIGVASDAFHDLGIETVGDLVPHQGPVRGFEAALLHARQSQSPSRIWMSCCDLWKIESQWYESLCSVYQPESLITCFRDNVWQPFPSCCSLDLLEPLQQFLATEGRSLQRLIDSLGTRATACSLEGLPPIRQANTPQELAALMRHENPNE